MLAGGCYIIFTVGAHNMGDVLRQRVSKLANYYLYYIYHKFIYLFLYTNTQWLEREVSQLLCTGYLKI
jgi:hypothetical protein